MRIIRDKHEGDLLVVNETVEVLGMIAGNLRLGDESEVILQGMVCGNVEVRAGKLTLNGMVNGDVINRGGLIYINGSVHGRVHEIGGRTSIASSAVVRE